MHRVCSLIYMIVALGLAGPVWAKESTVGTIPNPCDLIDKVAAEKVLGTKLTVMSEPGEGPYLATCRYDRPDGHNVAVVSVINNGDLQGYLGYLRKGGGIEFKAAPTLGAGALSSEAAVVLPLTGQPYTLLMNVTDVEINGDSIQQKPSPSKTLALAAHVKR